MKVKVKKLKENARIPRCQTETAAAADLYACLDAPLLLLPGQRVKIPTGIAIDYEDSDVVAVICARSGISAKHGISLTNGIGVVDPDYRWEFGEYATVNVKKEGGLSAGQHHIKAVQLIVPSYMPFPVEAVCETDFVIA